MISNTDLYGGYNFDTEDLTLGYYDLIFFKEADNSYENFNCYNHIDVSSIARHLTQIEPFDNPGDFIAADVSLDGEITSLDVSLIAQYIVNQINFHTCSSP